MLTIYGRWYTFLPPQWSTIPPPLTNRLTVATSKGAGATNGLVFRVPHLVAEGNDGGRHSNWSPMLRSIPPTWPVLTLLINDN